ncbi:hypothetical protein RRV45_05600 [Bacillus sp. DTU_2020_1000418_1_SI_GHA_SEK_038]|uniref:hypothetical protein n=1 Tax=Bacillus sp. DTU_2020_1000418_1_SI_GHA_SEK_038 TaxID=3077585 RepID=UPI0028E68459|nr:hypothetical protein [Bacillus sp. DTU_2020_1000418_1_SI_GHA_SEK_038]WNS76485.1 hypothetical protein RRV45_05600 [Bacillus sp. DTU_2020_1000418_1_SI_GHA_SEK_038]
MKKIIAVSTIVLVLLVGCQNNENRILDTSNLREREMNNLTNTQKEKMPIIYQALSVKEGLTALPFKMKLPKVLPFDALPFQPPTINDMSRDGKNLMVEFKTFSKGNSEKSIILMITAINSEEELDSSNSEEVKLNSGVTAYYTSNSLSFNSDGVSYNIAYTNGEIPKEQHKNEIMEIANQMIEQ